ncbi:hypothetical protein C0993_009470 [Termitomyces sp. T159_Od127]|nr:hypothetical protein C0993_009470 [Termitomyces sp. T159_Od127]
MLSSFRYAACLSSRRLYSTEPPKVPAALIGQLRKLIDVSIIKAREALSASNNDVKLALEWLEKDLAISGAAKAAKLEGRVAGEGIISTAVLSKGAGSHSGGLRAAMVELNCETDFVGRTENFSRLAASIAHTAAFISEQHGGEAAFCDLPLDLLNDAPLISETNPNPSTSVTVGNSIQSLIAQVGEKISLSRAVAIVNNPPQEQGDYGLSLGTYNHGGSTVNTQGRIGSLALLALKSPKLPELLASEAFTTNLTRLERSIARQIVGFPTTSITSDGQDLESALYHQDFSMFPEYSTDKVEVALEKWGSAQGLVDGGVSVVGFKRWTVGENMNA